MKKIFNTISETLLLVSLLVLFTIPVLVFSGFSPRVSSPKILGLAEVSSKVLGEQIVERRAGAIDYTTELLPSVSETIQVEELSKEEGSYRLQILIGPNGDEPRIEELVRLVNASDKIQKILVSLPEYASAEHLKFIKLQLDSSTINLADLTGEIALEPAATLNPNEWMNIGIIIGNELKEPSTFVLQMDIWFK